MRSRHVVELLTAHGADVTDVEVPDTSDAAAANLVIIRYEGFAVHRTNLAERGDDYAARTREFLSSGETVTEREYLDALEVRSAFARALDRVWSEVDVIVLPGSLGPAVRLDARGPIVGDVDFDGPWNLVGLPAIARLAVSVHQVCRCRCRSSARGSATPTCSPWPTPTSVTRIGTYGFRPGLRAESGSVGRATRTARSFRATERRSSI